MYVPWLRFYYSPSNEVGVRGSKQKQSVKKEYINGKIKISGTKPSAWSVTLNSVKSLNIYTYLYDLENEKNVYLETMKKSVSDRDRDTFSKVEKLYMKTDKEIEKIRKIIQDSKIELEKYDEQLFQIRRNIYMIKRKPLKDRNQKLIMKLTKEFEKVSTEKRDKQSEIDIKLNQYQPEASSVQQQGPVPDHTTHSTKVKKVKSGGYIVNVVKLDY